MKYRVVWAALAAVAMAAVSPALAHTEGEAAAPELAPWQQASAWPDRIVVTFEGDPATTLSVNWRTAATVDATRAEIAPALPDARFDRVAVSASAETERVSLAMLERAGVQIPVAYNAGLSPASYHSVRFDGLEPDTLYAYRVQGADGKWSEWFHTRTAPRSGPIRFIYLGDAQNGIDSHWPRVIRAAFQSAPDARFILHAGDLVNRASRDLEWAQWFRAASFIHGMIPAIPVTGNHEYESHGLTEADRQRALSFLWRPQFRLPVEAQLPAALHETVYAVRYSDDLHVFVLDSNADADGYALQANWLDAQLAASTARWRIVTQHHPIYSSGNDRDNPRLRDALLPVLLRHRVDLMLQGHDHTYARGTVEAQTPRRQGVSDAHGLTTMFVNSVSGAKQYKFAENGWDNYAATGVTLDRMGENTQFYQVISIDGDALHYEAYTADGQLYDQVRLTKAADGTTSIAPENNDLPETRRFENTLPYAGTDN